MLEATSRDLGVSLIGKVWPRQEQSDAVIWIIGKLEVGHPANGKLSVQHYLKRQHAIANSMLSRVPSVNVFRSQKHFLIDIRKSLEC